MTKVQAERWSSFDQLIYKDGGIWDKRYIHSDYADLENHEHAWHYYSAPSWMTGGPVRACTICGLEER